MLITVLFIIGITAEGMTGALSAGRQKMDLFGVVMIAEMTALGGGTIRDVVLGHYPLTWVRHPEYLLVVTGAAVLSVSISRLMKHFRSIFLALDAVGLAVFTVVGIDVAVEMGYGFLLALVSATITGVFGGVLRDIFCNRIPLVFRKELYASVVLLGVVVYWLQGMAGVDEEIATIVTLGVVFGARMLAVRFGWALPTFEYQERTYHRSERTKLWSGEGLAELRPVRHLRRARRRHLRRRERGRTRSRGAQDEGGANATS